MIYRRYITRIGRKNNLIKAENINDTSNKSKIFTKNYEKEYLSVDNQIVKVGLYEIFVIFDTDKESNIEVYLKMVIGK